MLFDMHCHVGFAGNTREVANQAATRGVHLLCATVTPREFVELQPVLDGCSNVRVGLGLHPWWAEEACNQQEQFDTYISQMRFIAEVGLDFGTRHAATSDIQVSCFTHIARCCATEQGKVLSLHAVHAADAVLDILEKTGCLSANTCIFHWFSGTSDQLQRALAAGCYFSVGTRMLATKRGRAYAQAIPLDRLLLETDAPSEPVEVFDGVRFEQQLKDALAALATIKGDGVRDAITSTSNRLWGTA